MPINNKKKEYSEWLPIWEKTRDAIAGQERVKGKSTKYLPKLSGQTDDSYLGYLERAQFINFASRTIQTALGQVYRKKPMIKDGEDIQNILDNIDLSGRNFDYFSRDVLSEVISVNRIGVLVDYSVEAERPYLVSYPAETIINWRVSNINGSSKLSLVVVQGVADKISESDIYKTEPQNIWREFFLNENGFYCVRDWEQKGNDFLPSEIIIPLMNGKPLDFIPFLIVNTNSVDNNILKAPMLDFVNLNYGHYKNDADYENMLHWCGAKTIVAKGWDESKSFPVGGCANFPTDGDAHFLEAAADSALLAELRHKEEQMAMLGSSLLSGKGRYVAAAETQRLQSEGENATLADVANALSLAFTGILKVVAEWNNTPSENLVVEFNTDFETSELNPQELTALMGAVQSGFMSFETYFYNLKNKEAYPNNWTIEDEEKAIEESMTKQMEARGGLSETQSQQTDNSDEEI